MKRSVYLPGNFEEDNCLYDTDINTKDRCDYISRTHDVAMVTAARGSTAGIPLLYPWANRLSGTRYGATGREVVLDPRSSLLHLDAQGLPMHGVPWARLAWEVARSTSDRITARLEWSRANLLAIFPHPHVLEMEVTLQPGGLTIATTLDAGREGPVPVSFGFHPYVGLPGLPRAEWRLSLPAMRRLELDQQGIPTGEQTSFKGFDGTLGDVVFDDGFALVGAGGVFALAGGGRKVTVDLASGYPFAQVFAPAGKDFIALEPMTAPANALITGRNLARVAPGGRFTAVFRILVEDAA